MHAKKFKDRFSKSLIVATSMIVSHLAAREAVAVELSAPFNKLFKKTRTRGPLPLPVDSEFEVPGEMTFPGSSPAQPLVVSVGVLGQSSLQELDFPKLKVKLASGSDGTPVSGLKNLRIGTHGFTSDGTGYTRIGRLMNSVSIVREAAVYDLLRILQIPAALHRRAQITYKDTETGETVSKPALILEGNKDLEKRLGGKRVDSDDREAANEAATHVPPGDWARPSSRRSSRRLRTPSGKNRRRSSKRSGKSRSMKRAGLS